MALLLSALDPDDPVGQMSEQTNSSARDKAIQVIENKGIIFIKSDRHGISMDLLITVLSLLAAIYAVLPRVMQLSLAVKLTFQMKLFMSLVLLATVYLSYYKFFEHLGLAFPPERWPEGLNASSAVPLLLLIALAIVTIHINYGSLPSRQIHRFSELARDLLWSRSMTDLVALIDKN